VQTKLKERLTASIATRVWPRVARPTAERNGNLALAKAGVKFFEELTPVSRDSVKQAAKSFINIGKIFFASLFLPNPEKRKGCNFWGEVESNLAGNSLVAALTHQSIRY
jgi:hypothetical protein